MRHKEKLFGILLRYSILLILAFSGFSIIYLIFDPLTKYPLYLLFNSFYDIYITPTNIINFRNYSISLEIVGACIAGSAYFLLTMLNLSTPNIKISRRIKIFGLSFGIFLLFNILRIFFIGVLFLNGASWAEFLHKFLWYFGSIILVILIWFYQVKKFNIKETPFYSDINYIFKEIRKN